MTEWRDLEWDECASCGDDVEVKTDSNRDGFVYDGELVRCVSCGYTGSTVVEEDSTTWVNWENPGTYYEEQKTEG